MAWDALGRSFRSSCRTCFWIAPGDAGKTQKLAPMPAKSQRFGPQPGQVVKVKNVWGGYPLPESLSEGDEVVLMDFGSGYWNVEHDGQPFRIFMANVDPDASEPS